MHALCVAVHLGCAAACNLRQAACRACCMTHQQILHAHHSHQRQTAGPVATTKQPITPCSLHHLPVYISSQQQTSVHEPYLVVSPWPAPAHALTGSYKFHSPPRAKSAAALMRLARTLMNTLAVGISGPGPGPMAALWPRPSSSQSLSASGPLLLLRALSQRLPVSLPVSQRLTNSWPPACTSSGGGATAPARHRRLMSASLIRQQHAECTKPLELPTAKPAGCARMQVHATQPSTCAQAAPACVALKQSMQSLTWLLPLLGPGCTRVLLPGWQ